MSPSEITLASQSRVWITEDGAGPFNQPLYQGCMKIGDTEWNFGDIEKVECPDPNNYGRFVEAAEIQGQTERPTTSIMGRYPRDLSDLLRLAKKQCKLDVQVHIGKCRSPQDFSEGWEKIKVYPTARIATWSDENAGAIESDENEPTNEEVEVSSADLFELKKLAFEEQAATQVVREIKTIDVCDAASCGDCEDPSNGCEKVFATMVGVGVTPGTQPSVVYSGDGGDSWAVTTIDTMFSNESPYDAACIGGYFVIASRESLSLHFANIQDILDGVETWLETITGFVPGGGPNALWSVDSRHTWIVGQAGYIYFSQDPTSRVMVQCNGNVTLQNLTDVVAYDTENVLAIGEFNACVYSSNGGVVWNAVTGPAPAVALTAAWMYGPKVWVVGDASGRVFKTRNAGLTWTQYTNMPVTLLRIEDIEMVNSTVGYMAARDGAAHSLVLRTIDGGYSWYVLPEGPGGIAIPDNDRLNDVAPCKADPNIVWAGGLGGGGSDGIILKAA